MADQKINELPTKTAPSTGDKMLMIGTAEEYQIDYDKLASAILDKLATKQYSELDTTSKTVLGAIDELNGKTKNIIYETKEYPDFSFDDLTYAIKDYIDNHAVIRNSILLVNLKMNSNYIGIVQIYDSNYASAFFIGYPVTTPVYMQKAAGVWKYSIIQAESHPLS